MSLSFTTHIAHLPDGNDIQYMDSGPVKGSPLNYTTVILVHGLAFNSHVFDPLHVLAPKYNLRLIAVQRKGYKGSTPYNEDEMEVINKGSSTYIDANAILYGHLIEYLIRTHDLPEPRIRGDVREGGGVMLLGWSLGCARTNAILFDHRLFGEERYQFLRKYLTGMVLYDPAVSAFGLEIPRPMHGGVPLLERPRLSFLEAVSSHFDTPANWNGTLEQLNARTNSRPTTNSWTKEQLEAIFEPTVSEECEWPITRKPMQDHLRNLTERAFFDEDNIKNTFPDVPVLMITCWESLTSPLLGYQIFTAACKENKAKGKFIRPISIEIKKEANHLWHWECPEEFLETIANFGKGANKVADLKFP